jgi:hypothetical protein
MVKESRMLRRAIRGVLAFLLVAGVAATALAQRGGYRGGYTQTYSANVPYDGRFTFVRLSYPSFGRRGAQWAHDWPRGEEHFLKIFSELTATPVRIEASNIMGLGDPELFRFPVAYMCEPGYWSFNDEGEAIALRDYLLKGGFLVLDDFRNNDWYNLDLQVSRMFPNLKFIDLDATHPIFHSFFEINDLNILPQAYDAGRPVFSGLFEDNDPTKRMMIVAAFNTDMSEFWEWSDTGYAPLEMNNEAYKLGINLFMYGITH